MSQPEGDYASYSPDETPGENEFRLNEPLRSFFRAAREVLLRPGRFFSEMALSGSDRGPVSFGVACITVGFVIDVGLSTFGVESPGEVAGGLSSAVAQLDGPGQWLGGLGGVQLVLAVVLAPLAAALLVAIIAGIQLFWLVIRAAVVHLFVLFLLGENERAGLELTIRVFSYTSVVALLTWLPYVGWIASVYGIYLLYIGLRTAHRRASSSAVAAEGGQEA